MTAKTVLHQVQVAAEKAGNIVSLSPAYRVLTATLTSKCVGAVLRSFSKKFDYDYATKTCEVRMFMNVERKPNKNSFKFSAYLGKSPKRILSYYHQIEEALQVNPNRVLVVGKGDNIVPVILKNEGIDVETFDVLEDLKPTYCGDIREFIEVIENRKFDCIMCCQVLEHIPFKDFENVIQQFSKTATQKVIISLPVSSISAYFDLGLPKNIRFYLSINIPYFIVKGKIMEKHCWEIGHGSIKQKDVINLLNKYFTIVRTYRVKTYEYHRFFILEPKKDK